MNTEPKKENHLIETAELIVIDYANFSGRESAHRAEFREKVIKHISSLLSFHSIKNRSKMVNKNLSTF